MDNEYLLVQWIHESPVRFSVMQAGDIAKDSDRARPTSELLNIEVGFKWKKKVCIGLVVAIGKKSALEEKISNGTATTLQIKTKAAPKKRRLTTRDEKDLLQRSTKLGKVLDDPVANNESNEKIALLESKLETSTNRIKNLEEQILLLEAENAELKSQQNHNDETDIGNGVMLKKEFLLTVKATSGSTNIFGRCLFKKLFDCHEVVGYSLMGKGCAANKTEKLPSIDPRKRDALIDYTIRQYGAEPGTKQYHLEKQNLKKSLASLMLEMNKNAQETEALLNTTTD